MDDADRQLLRRCRVRLVNELQVAPLWDALLSRELFTPGMIEDIQQAGSGSRGDQARQLVIDLETRGSQALPLFISCLEDTGQNSLASLLKTSRQAAKWDPEAIRPLDLMPTPGKLTPVVLGPELRPEVLRPEVPRPVDIGSGGISDIGAQKRLRGNADLEYILNADPCGHCLIINNVNFSLGLSTRDGSDIDCEKLQRRFHSLHFMVEVKDNLTGKQMVHALMELAQRDHGALDCCVVVILSHGCEVSHRQFPGAVYGTDGCPVSIEKIVNILNGAGCPSLGGKPKLFFIQACGGGGPSAHPCLLRPFLGRPPRERPLPAPVPSCPGRPRSSPMLTPQVLAPVPLQVVPRQVGQIPESRARKQPEAATQVSDRTVQLSQTYRAPLQARGASTQNSRGVEKQKEQKDHGFKVVSTSSEDEAPDSDPETDSALFQDNPGNLDQPDAVSSLPTPSDIFVSYSTFPGFVSWRNTKSGSWYVETLDSIFEQWAHLEDLQSLLLRVANAVSEKGIYKQIPGCFNFLRKKLFFKT